MAHKIVSCETCARKDDCPDYMGAGYFCTVWKDANASKRRGTDESEDDDE